tara:strand:- start:934 stop:1524 length:591 start_codon:yes stop_codon:yes gene_type:complete
MSDFITLEEYKQSEGIASPKEDLRLELLIPSVSQLVKTYCGNSIIDYYTTNKIETLNVNWDTHIIQLTESPINTIIKVEERNSYNAAYAELTEAAYAFYLDAGTDSLLRTTGGINYTSWAKGPGSVRVTYTAGYATCPADLKLAVIDMITYYIKDEHKERRTMQGASIQNAGSTTQANNVAFPDHIKRVLDLYKNF